MVIEAPSSLVQTQMDEIKQDSTPLANKMQAQLEADGVPSADAQLLTLTSVSDAITGQASSSLHLKIQSIKLLLPGRQGLQRSMQLHAWARRDVGSRMF